MSGQIITDFELDAAFAFTDFGAHKNNRDILKMGVLKAASGYSSGFTLFQIMISFDLIKGNTRKFTLTKKGKQFLYESFKIEGHQ